jgi:hypothetical protein
VNIIHLASALAAQEMPSSYRMLAYFYASTRLTYHPTLQWNF